MDDVTTIDSNDISISSPKDRTVKGLLLEDNQNVKFLPVRVYEKFPSLVGLSAFDCKIKIITKANFEKLDKLKEIHMHGNLIEKISSDTFEDLISLEQIFLGELTETFVKTIFVMNFLGQNKIKQIKGEVFLGLPNLHDVSLIDNVCVDKSYHHRIMIDSMVSDLRGKCDFEEDEDNGSKHDPNVKAKTSGLKTWMIILFVVLALLAVGAGVYLKFYHVPGMRYF